MKTLLYIGNKLSRHGSTATAIETLGPLLGREGFDVQYASSKKNTMLRLADMVFKTLRLKRKADYVLIDTYSTRNFWYAVIVARICRISRLKYIPVLHGGNLPSRLQSSPRLSAALFGNAYKNVAPSGYLYEAFSAAGFKVISIPNPFDAADFPFTQRKSIKPRLLWVRSFAAICNPAMAIEAFALVKLQFPDATLCMVGPDNGQMAAAKLLARQKNLEIEFTGRLTKTQWAQRSESCDIFLNTSRVDNSPFSIVEAAALGLVVVSTNVGGIPYLLKDRESGLLVPDDDANAMAAAVAEAVGNRELSQQLLENSAKIVARCQWKSVGEKWLEILK